jgi:hypothetical protein
MLDETLVGARQVDTNNTGFRAFSLLAIVTARKVAFTGEGRLVDWFPQRAEAKML